MIKNTDLPGDGIEQLELIGQETVAVSAVAAALAAIPADTDGRVVALVISVGAQPVRIGQLPGFTPASGDGFRVNGNTILPWTLMPVGVGVPNTNAERFGDFQVILDDDATTPGTTLDIAYLGWK